MRKVALIFNPASGVRRERRAAEVESVRQVLLAAGVEAEAAPTRSAGSAEEQARESIAAGCDAILACGGDGTAHEALQGIVGAGGRAALGVIPLGTGNALANDLGLPRNPVEAARALLAGEARRIALGRMEFALPKGGTGSRYFLVMAGAGPDAHMLYSMSLEAKGRFGMGAYYAHAAWLFLTHDYPAFEVEVTESESGKTRTMTVAQMMAARITFFGGALRRLAPGAALYRDDMCVVLYRTPIRLRYFLYLLGVFLGLNWRVPGVELVHATQVLCRELEPKETRRRSTVRAEADGELLGLLPVRLTMVPD
ncbi:MAG: diacylglycerol/lipid kinase family protein, partial [Terriglobales bacterium]